MLWIVACIKQKGGNKRWRMGSSETVTLWKLSHWMFIYTESILITLLQPIKIFASMWFLQFWYLWLIYENALASIEANNTRKYKYTSHMHTLNSILWRTALLKELKGSYSYYIFIVMRGSKPTVCTFCKLMYRVCAQLNHMTATVNSH